MYYVGLDLHKKYITGCVLDSQGAVVAEERRLPPVLETLLGWLAPLGQPVAVALEATLYWAWLHDRLTAAGYQVAVAHPQQVKLICHARCKTDPVDARKLADLLRTDLLPAIWIPDAATRARRTGCCRRFRGSGRLGRSCCSPRSERSPGLVRVTSWRRMRGWCRARGARAGRPPMGRSAPRGVRGSSGCSSKRCRR